VADEQKNKSAGADGFMPWFKETFPYGLAGKDSPLSFLRAKSDEEKTPGMKRGGSVSSASKRADGCAQRGKTRGKMR
jgi:hypothetical protein